MTTTATAASEALRDTLVRAFYIAKPDFARPEAMRQSFRNRAHRRIAVLLARWMRLADLDGAGVARAVESEGDRFWYDGDIGAGVSREMMRAVFRSHLSEEAMAFLDASDMRYPQLVRDELLEAVLAVSRADPRFARIGRTQAWLGWPPQCQARAIQTFLATRRWRGIADECAYARAERAASLVGPGRAWPDWWKETCR